MQVKDIWRGTPPPPVALELVDIFARHGASTCAQELVERVVAAGLKEWTVEEQYVVLPIYLSFLHFSSLFPLVLFFSVSDSLSPLGSSRVRSWSSRSQLLSAAVLAHKSCSNPHDKIEYYQQHRNKVCHQCMHACISSSHVACAVCQRRHAAARGRHVPD